MEEELYDEFGNYIGPDIEEDEEAEREEEEPSWMDTQQESPRENGTSTALVVSSGCKFQALLFPASKESNKRIQKSSCVFFL